MPKRPLVTPSALLTVLLLAACGTDSPTVTGPALDVAASKKPRTCVFMTPNGNTHTSSAAKCPTPAPVAQVAGTYEITRFTFRQWEWDGEERRISQLYDVADYLAEDGAQFTLTLHPDGTTSGRFYAPEDPEEPGSGLNLNLAGSWRLDGDTVVLDTTDDTFLDMLPYTYADGRLTAGPATVGEEDDPFFIEEVILTRR